MPTKTMYRIITAENWKPFCETETELYLIHDLDSGLTKIGYASDAEKRLKAILTQKPLLPRPHNFILLFKWTGIVQEESDLHVQFKGKRVRGEWFSLTPTDIEFIKETKSHHQVCQKQDPIMPSYPLQSGTTEISALTPNCSMER